jgi:hypothetical protein
MRVPIMMGLVALALAVPVQAQQEKKKKVVLPPDSIYLLPVKSLEGKPADLKEQAGIVTLIVNLASQ